MSEMIEQIEAAIIHAVAELLRREEKLESMGLPA